MRDELRFEGEAFKRYVLIHWPREPSWPSWARFQKVEPSWALRIVLAAIRDRYGSPNWPLLHFLRIDKHPANLSGGELRQVVESRLRGIPRPVLFEELREPPARKAPPSFERLASAKVPLSATSAWVGVECVYADDGRPMSGVRLEVITASADVRSAYSDEKGAAFVDRIAPGQVTIRVINVDGSLWKPAQGPAAAPSGADERPTWSTVKWGESLSQMARKAGLDSWRKIWNHEKNEGLRQKRAHPSRVVPGDDVAVPALRVFEITREAEQTHRLELTVTKPRNVFVLSADDLRFHRSSCVFLGECGDVTDPKTLSGASGIDALAAALEHARTGEGQTMLVVGHCDRSGDPEQNQQLSEMRARALKHLLLGEREPWGDLVRVQSTIADYQQILAWLSVVRGWPCAPFAIDDREQPDNTRILRAFQVAYNRHFSASIAETASSALRPGARSSTYIRSSSPRASRPTGPGSRRCAIT